MTAHGFGRRALGTVLDMPRDGRFIALVFVQIGTGYVVEIKARWNTWAEGWQDENGKPLVGTIRAWRPWLDADQSQEDQNG